MPMEEYFRLAEKVAKKSDYGYGTPVGAVLLNGDGDVLTTGYNKFPCGIDKGEILSLSRKFLSSYVVHAEMVALMLAIKHQLILKGGTLVVTRYPCIPCLVNLREAGITSIHFLDRKSFDGEYERYKGVIDGMTFWEYSSEDYSLVKKYSTLNLWAKSVVALPLIS